MKYIKQYILAAAIALSLFGCGNSSDKPQEKEYVSAPTQEQIEKAPEVQKVGETQTITINGNDIKAPKNSVVKIDIDKSRMAESKGAKVRTSSDQVAQTIKADPPNVSLDGSKAEGGSFDFINKMKVSTGSAIFYTIGAMVLLGGLAISIFVNVQKGLMVALAGVAVVSIGVFIDQYPWLFLIIPVLLVGAIVYLVVEGKTNNNLKDVVTNIVKGVAHAETKDPESAQVVKDSIAKNDTDGIVKEVVSKIKSKLNIVA